METEGYREPEGTVLSTHYRSALVVIESECVLIGGDE